MSNTTQPTLLKSNRPTHRVYLVQDGIQGRKDSWTEIGAIWPHKDGQGGNVQFKATPLEILSGKGRIVYREIRRKDEAAH